MHGAISWDLSKHGQKICPRLIRHLRAIFAQLRHTHYEKKNWRKKLQEYDEILNHTYFDKQIWSNILSRCVFFTNDTICMQLKHATTRNTIHILN